MSKIDDIKAQLQANGYFFHDSGENYVRILDTPRVWGMPFGPAIMPQAIQRQGEFERAIVEIVQKARYRCDVASLNSPDPDWARAILGAMDTALTNNMGRTQPTQFRFLFGQTPLSIFSVGDPPNFTEFKAALVRLIRARSSYWEMLPEIWVGRFYELEDGLLQAFAHKFLPASVQSDDDTKMTWNHSKIIAVDGAESLVGGHNLNMDLFRSYPPVHDVSVVVHGQAPHGSQLFLNEMWNAGPDFLAKDELNAVTLTWSDNVSQTPIDPLAQGAGQSFMQTRQADVVSIHQSGTQPGTDPVIPDPQQPIPAGIPEQDLQTLNDLEFEVIPERVIYNTWDAFDEYTRATRMFSVGKYWTGPYRETDYKKGSELMKQSLILGATRTIKMSQMDLVSAWKKNWSDHVVCQWIIQALLANPRLTVQAVVSPLDAGAGAEGDQYSFGSGAVRTFDLIEYYMTHAIDDTLLPDPDGARADALRRLFIAPLYFTDIDKDGGPIGDLVEGTTYKWPDLTPEGYTATLKAPSLDQNPPNNGIIGQPLHSVFNASGYIYPKVESAPGNHAKIMIVDDEVYVVGSDNLYPGALSEFNYLVEGEAVNDLLTTYWNPLWNYSKWHARHVCQDP